MSGLVSLVGLFYKKLVNFLNGIEDSNDDAKDKTLFSVGKQKRKNRFFRSTVGVLFHNYFWHKKFFLKKQNPFRKNNTLI